MQSEILSSRFIRFKSSGVGKAILLILMVLLPFIMANALTKLTLVGPEWMHIRNAIKVVALVAGYIWYVRTVEQRPCTELSLAGAVSETALGFALAALIITATVVLLWLAGFYQVQGLNFNTSILSLFGGFFSVAVLEEILFRALLFRLLEKWLGSWLALLASALLFGLAHLLNPNADVVTTLQLVVLSLIFTAAFLYSRRMWLCIGMHWGWNFVQGGLFSVAVSGMEAKGLFQSVMSGPAWLTGGDFGVEGSVITTVFCLICLGFLLFKALKRHQLLQPAWRR
jgi:uncharacterized protein